MQFLAFSDIHFDLNHNKSYVTDDGLTSWVHVQLDILDQIFKYATDNKIFDIFFGGDIFEKKNYLPQNLYNIVWDAFEKQVRYEKFDIHINTGNHDYHSKVSGALKPFSNLVDVITKPKDIIFENTLVKVVPHGMLDGNLGIPDSDCLYNILFTHEDIAGLKYGFNEYTSGAKYKSQIFREWDYVFNGHIHKAQKLGNIINMGSVMRQDFGETDKKFFYHFNDGDIKNIEINCPEFILIPGLSNKIKDKIEKDLMNFYRIDISSEEITDPIFKKYNIFPNVIKIKEKKKRLDVNLSEEEEVLKYMEIMESDLDKERVLKFIKEVAC